MNPWAWRLNAPRVRAEFMPTCAGLADDLHCKSCAAQPRLQGGLITDDQHMRQCATQRGQGVQRHRPREPAPQGIGYGESGLGMLDWFESDHRRRVGAWPSSGVGVNTHADELLSRMTAHDPTMLPRSRKVKPLMAQRTHPSRP